MAAPGLGTGRHLVRAVGWHDAFSLVPTRRVCCRRGGVLRATGVYAARHTRRPVRGVGRRRAHRGAHLLPAPRARRNSGTV